MGGRVRESWGKEGMGGRARARESSMERKAGVRESWGKGRDGWYSKTKRILEKRKVWTIEH